MISRSRTLFSTSSSRQMMMAWKVSGLSHNPAIIASRPASMRLAMAISPSRDNSSTEPISRRYIRTGSSVRSVGSEVRVATALAATGSDQFAGFRLFFLGGRFFLGFLGLFRLDDVDAHFAEHGVDVLDLVGGDLFRWQDGVQFGVSDEAALFGELHHALDGGVGEIKQGAVGDLRHPGFAFRLRFVFFRHVNSNPQMFRRDSQDRRKVLGNS